MRAFLRLIFLMISTPVMALTFRIDPSKDVHAINPLIYGSNQSVIPETTLARSGGNRMTGYNWETNASHAGADWKNQNDFWLLESGGLSNNRNPGSVVEKHVRETLARHSQPLITLQMAGYVAGDGSGPVDNTDAAPSPRWKEVKAKKGAPFAYPPNTEDDYVYMDEQVAFLVSKFGKAAQGGLRYFCLDNESALWPSTHSRIHPKSPTYEEVVRKGAETAQAVLDVDDGAEFFGPVEYGWMEHLSLQNAPDSKQWNPEFGTFSGYYLAKMKEASDKAGRRLLHFFDIHWYPEAKGDHRITMSGEATTDADIEARVQAPRSLWDPTYVENSWVISANNGRPLCLLPMMKGLVDKYYPGTKLALTEWDYGAPDHPSGGVAAADVLGVFGRFDMAACYWGEGKPYLASAFKLYLNYDGKGAKFGDYSVFAEADDPAKGSAHAARDSKDPSRMTVILISRDPRRAQQAKVLFPAGAGRVAAIRAWRFDASSSAIKELSSPPAPSAEGFSDSLPALSVTLYELRYGA